MGTLREHPIYHSAPGIDLQGCSYFRFLLAFLHGVEERDSRIPQLNKCLNQVTFFFFKPASHASLLSQVS